MGNIKTETKPCPKCGKVKIRIEKVMCAVCKGKSRLSTWKELPSVKEGKVKLKGVDSYA